MTQANHPSPGGSAPPTGVESLLEELIEATRKLQPHHNPVRRTTAWILAACITAVIANIAVPGAHRAYVTAGCYVKYFAEPRITHPSTSSWRSFGVTSIKPLSASSLMITPSAQGYIWFGADMPFTRYCDYRISFKAELIGPMDPRLVGYGYGIGVRGTTINGVPDATTIQYDPPNGGLRIALIPCCANSPGYNSISTPDVIAGAYHFWSLDVIGPDAYVSYDSKGYGQMNLGSGNEILIRVWNASVVLKDIAITPIRPSV
jgi:hypothetical protein